MRSGCRAHEEGDGRPRGDPSRAWQDCLTRFPGHGQRSDCESLPDCAVELTAMGRGQGQRRARSGRTRSHDPIIGYRFAERPNQAVQARGVNAPSSNHVLGRRNSSGTLFRARSRLSPTARNVEQRAGHIGRRIADQPDGRLGDFFSRAGASHRSGRAQNACAVRLASAGVDIGVDEPRADGVDPDALGAKFLGETQWPLRWR